MRRLYVAVLGLAATFAVQKLLSMGWKAVTGSEPPSPTDPRTPMHQALTWVLASAGGIGVAQLLTQRMAARRWSEEMGNQLEGKGKWNKIRIWV